MANGSNLIRSTFPPSKSESINNAPKTVGGRLRPAGAGNPPPFTRLWPPQAAALARGLYCMLSLATTLLSLPTTGCIKNRQEVVGNDNRRYTKNSPKSRMVVRFFCIAIFFPSLISKFFLLAFTLLLLVSSCCRSLRFLTFLQPALLTQQPFYVEQIGVPTRLHHVRRCQLRRRLDHA